MLRVADIKGDRGQKPAFNAIKLIPSKRSISVAPSSSPSLAKCREHRVDSCLSPCQDHPLGHRSGSRINARTRFGILTPSSNTALEPLTSALVAGVFGVSAHFSRFTVTEIALHERAQCQFDPAPVLATAKLLSDAYVDVIGWSGTSAGWLGFERDMLLCEQIQAATGIPATTSVLALNEILALAGIHRIALYTPYTEDVQRQIIKNYRTLGIDCVAERHLGISVNFDFALVEPERIEADCVKLLEESEAQAVVTFCTNLRAAQLAESIEFDRDVLLLDTVSTVLWKMLLMADCDPRQLTGWGRLFSLMPD